MRLRNLTCAVLLMPLMAGCAAGAAAGKDKPTATTASKYATYQALARRENVPDDMLTEESDAESVAANLCDNTVGEMEDLMRMEMTIHQGAELTAAATEKGAMVKAYCPDKTIALQTAVKDLVAEMSSQLGDG